jgi:hypothetical protein
MKSVFMFTVSDQLNKETINLYLSSAFFILGWSSDGASPFMKAMKIVSELGSLGSRDRDVNCPTEFKPFYRANIYPLYNPFQDSVHIAVKMLRCLALRQLIMGYGAIASMSQISNLQNRYGGKSARMSTGLNAGDTTENKDRMNYAVADRMSKVRVTSLLNVNDESPEEEATKTFLQLIRHVIDAYIDEETEVNDRLFSALFCDFFTRCWRETLGVLIERNHLGASMARNFVTQNVETCIVLNSHSLLSFLINCRDNSKPELFLPSLTGSQSCENTFEALRSMSTTNSTVVNFDVLDVVRRVKRLNLLQKLPDICESFKFKKAHKHKLKPPTRLPENVEIEKIAKAAFNEVVKKFQKLRKLS